ncbi:MAG: RNA polymerase factor sigma-54 [Phycisphaerales bacterium]|nr:RNA polymerase factor sigma-54 [Phycisphaerales bacterium]
MRFEASQHMKLGQHMKLAPRMIQSMEILQMPLAELEERIEQELESNPTLEVVETDDPAARQEIDEARRDDQELERPLTVDGESGAADFARLDSFEADNPELRENEYDGYQRPREREGAEATYSASRQGGERDAKMDAFAAAPARTIALSDQLKAQWSLADVEDSIRPVGELVIAHLDEDGYLRTPLETLAEKSRASGAGYSVEEIERAVLAVQLFLEPAGVGARTPGECLLLQLDDLQAEGESLGWPSRTFESARRLVGEHLDDVLQNRLPRIAEKTGLSLDEIKDALTLLRRLSLSPARRLVEEETRPIVPDAIVEYDTDEDRYVAYLNEPRSQNLRLNREYALLSKDKEVEKRDREFLKTNLSNAQWLIEAVAQRKHTLLRVIRAVVEAQRDYFDFGAQALKPLPMTLVAEQLGIHVATVSRAVAEKYLLTPRGVVPLRRFFSGGLHAEGEDLAWDAVKAALKEIIDAEDKAKPLSDEALVDELKKRGIEIARRTVAKYRDQLSIPTARLRKTF